MNYFVVRSGSCITYTIHFRVEVKCVSASRWDEDGSIYILGETERDGQRQIGVRGNIEISIRQMHTGDACVFMLEKFFFLSVGQRKPRNSSRASNKFARVCVTAQFHTNLSFVMSICQTIFLLHIHALKTIRIFIFVRMHFEF